VTCDGGPASIIVAPSNGEPLLTLASLDAFGNLRVSNPQTLFDSKQVFDKDALNFFAVTAGGGTSTYTQQRSSTILATAGGAGDSAVRQTKRYFNYQPGKGQRIDVTFVLRAGNPDADKDVGYFDSLNGLFLRQTGSNLFIVRRSDVSGVAVDFPIAQSDWNQDPCDGTGPSGYKILPDKAQVMRIDFEWLGTGPARVGFQDPDKGFVYAHQFHNTNELDSVYMRSPNLPVRYAITQNGAGSAASLEAICCTVVSEGGQQLLGNVFAADRGITDKAVGAANLVSLIAIRLRGPGSTLPAPAINLRRTVQLLAFTIASTAAGDTSLYRLLLNPTRGAGTAPTWTAANADSSVEYDVTSAEVITGGYEVDAGYAQGRNTFASTSVQQARPGADYAGAVADELVLAAQSLTGTNHLLASMQWAEL
jgi:hypothetical protein